MIFYLLSLAFNVFSKNVILHLEKIPGGITHTGISFKTPIKRVRYDFRAFNENNTCVTSDINNENGKNLKRLYPNLYDPEFNEQFRYILENFFKNEPFVIKKDVILGSTEKTFQEIETYSCIINKKYIFGIYDCRHYVDKMSIFCDTGNIPIWNLKSYF
tara:strand:+ start:8457 stop:8933 length:477 start_codon:yes stop_codon:yes gene_type:complete